MKHKIILHQQQSVFFAPSFFYYDLPYVFVTYGSRSDLAFEPKDWGGGASENWYTHGKNILRLYQCEDRDTWIESELDLFDISSFSDVMKASVVVRGKELYVWFSGLRGVSWNIYFVKYDGVDWSEPEPIHLHRDNTAKEHVFLPCVRYHEASSCYQMWFVGRDGKNRRIHYAKSRDGIEWSNFGCVMELGEQGEFDAYAVDCPDVVLCKGQYFMVYGAGTARGIALATSSDGLKWNKLGLVLTRGGEQDNNYLYSFYPCLYSLRNQLDDNLSGTELCFAGENKQGEWSILRFEEFQAAVQSLLSFSKKPLFYENWLLRYQEISNIPVQYLALQEDCNCQDCKYEGKQFLQLRPSSVPVFWDKLNGNVIKLPRTRVNGETEYMGSLLLRKQLRINPVQIRYDCNTAVLLSRYLTHQGSLGKIASENERVFQKVYTELLTDLQMLFLSTEKPYDSSLICYTGQTRELMLQWLRTLEKEVCNYSYADLQLEGTSLNLLRELCQAQKYISDPPNYLVLSSGDLHFNNVLSVDGHYMLIDSEYLGYFDIDYIVAKLLGSCIKHTDALQEVQYQIFPKTKNIKFQITYCNCFMERIHQTDWYAAWLRGLPINYRRVRAYMLAKLYFRLNASQNMENRMRALGMFLCMASLCDRLEGADDSGCDF